MIAASTRRYRANRKITMMKSIVFFLFHSKEKRKQFHFYANDLRFLRAMQCCIEFVFSFVRIEIKIRIVKKNLIRHILQVRFCSFECTIMREFVNASSLLAQFFKHDSCICWLAHRMFFFLLCNLAEKKSLPELHYRSVIVSSFLFNAFNASCNYIRFYEQYRPLIRQLQATL